MSRNRRAIEDHFDVNNELESILRSKGKDEQADMVRNIIPEGVKCILVRQAKQMEVDGSYISKYGVVVPNGDGVGIAGLIEKPNAN